MGVHTDRKTQSTQQRLVLANFRCDALKTREGIKLFSLPFGTQVKSWNCEPQGSQAKEEKQTLMLTTTYLLDIPWVPWTCITTLSLNSCVTAHYPHTQHRT